MKEEMIYIGKLSKIYGNNGEFILKIENQDFKDFKINEPVFIEINNRQVPFFIKEHCFKGNNSILILFDDIVTENRTKLLLNKKVFISTIKKIKKKIIFDIFSLKGFTLFDNNSVQLGEIISVENYSSNVVLEIKYLKKKILIPFNEELITQIDIKKKQLYLIIPDGLLDLYFSSGVLKKTT